MKVDPLKIPDDAPRGKRPSKDDEPKAAPKKNWKEREGFFQGARIKRK
jgi:hypothetical protein